MCGGCIRRPYTCRRRRVVGARGCLISRRPTVCPPPRSSARRRRVASGVAPPHNAAALSSMLQPSGMAMHTVVVAPRERAHRRCARLVAWLWHGWCGALVALRHQSPCPAMPWAVGAAHSLSGICGAGTAVWPHGDVRSARVVPHTFDEASSRMHGVVVVGWRRVRPATRTSAHSMVCADDDASIACGAGAVCDLA